MHKVLNMNIESVFIKEEIDENIVNENELINPVRRISEYANIAETFVEVKPDLSIVKEEIDDSKFHCDIGKVIAEDVGDIYLKKETEEENEPKQLANTTIKDDLPIATNNNMVTTISYINGNISKHALTNAYIKYYHLIPETNLEISNSVFDLSKSKKIYKKQKNATKKVTCKMCFKKCDEEMCKKCREKTVAAVDKKGNNVSEKTVVHAIGKNENNAREKTVVSADKKENNAIVTTIDAVGKKKKNASVTTVAVVVSKGNNVREKTVAAANKNENNAREKTVVPADKNENNAREKTVVPADKKENNAIVTTVAAVGSKGNNVREKTVAAANKNENNASGTVLTCHVCGIKYTNKYYMKRHMDKHDPDKWHHCELCDYKSTNSHNLLSHIKHKHTKQKDFECSTCGTKFTTKASLTSHIRSHTGEKPYACHLCDFRSSMQSNLNNHIKYIHTKERPHVCDVCGDTFVTRSCYNIHYRIHTGEKPYACKFCEYKSTNSWSLRHHVTRMHTTEKRKYCDLCDYSCVTKHQIRVHIQRHMGIKPYKCEFCDYRSWCNSNVRTHLRVHNKKKPLPTTNNTKLVKSN